MTRPQWVSNLEIYDSQQDWTTEFYTRLAETSKVFVRSDGTLTYVHPAAGPQRVFSVEDFQGMAGNCLNARYIRNKTDLPHALQRNEAVALINAVEKTILDPLEFVLHEPAVLTVDGVPRLIHKPGYDPVARSYLWIAPGRTAIEPRDGTEHLTTCLSGVPFRSEAYRNNVIAWLVSAMSLDESICPPMLTVTGNDRGVGKSSLVQACGFILTGETPNAIAPTGAEFEKQLGAKFAAEKRFIMLDNLTTGGRSFSQPRLSNLLTEGKSKQVRMLGRSRNITLSGVLFALTANDAKLDQDLATRSLPVALYKENPGPMSPYVLQYAKEHRAEIFGELLGLAVRRDPVLAIPDEYTTCRFVDWIRYVVPIVQPVFGGLAIQESEHLDDRFQDLFGWGADRLEDPFTARQLYDIVRSSPDSLPGLAESVSLAKGERSKVMRLAKFIAQCSGKSHFISDDLTIELQPGEPAAGGTATYVFKEVL